MLNPEGKDKKDSIHNYYKEVGPYVTLGLQLAVTVGLMVFVGYWIDSKNGTSPLYTLIFSILGIASGLYNFLKTVFRYSEKDKNENRKNS